MKKRYIFGILALAATAYVVRLTVRMLQDVERYNRILAMSDEGTVGQEAPELLLQAARQQAQTIKEFRNFARSAPKDAVRYVKIGSM